MLPSKTRIHAHDQHFIHQIENLAQRRDRRGRIQYDARQCPFVPDGSEGTVQMDASFLMNQDVIGASS